jgi:hypothetical protein
MKVAFLTNPSRHAAYLVDQTSRRFPTPVWLVERRPAAAQVRALVRRRKYIGWRGVLGTCLLRVYSRFFEKPVEVLPPFVVEQPQPIEVDSINSPRVVDEVRRHGCDVCLVVGTSLIHRSVLAQLPRWTINLHGGISPLYRGSNCCIWACLNDDLENLGLTWHVIDAGVDTGQILRQVRLTLSPGDTQSTIFARQSLEAWPALAEMLEEYDRTGQIQPRPPAAAGEGRLYFTPTLAQYLRFKRKLAGRA